MALNPSIGLRWTLRYTVVMSVTLTIFATVVYSVVEYRINRDARLVTQIEARALADSLRTQTQEHPRPVVMDWLEGRLRRMVLESDPELGLGAQYLDPEGRPVLSSGSLERQVVPVPADLLRGERAEGFRAVNLGGPHAHVLTVLAVPDGFLQVAIDTRRYVENVRDVRDVLAAALPVMIVLTGGLGWLLARGSLHPIGRMAASAERISTSNLRERIATSGSGDELDRLAHTLNAMVERLEDDVRRMRRFNANAAHELRSPLSRICSEIELAFESGKEEDYGAVLADVLSRVRQLAGAVDALLRLSQLQAGLDPEGVRPVRIAEVLETVVEFFEPVATQAGRIFEAGPRVDAVVAGDRAWLHQLFSNLVDNAIKYTAPGDRISVGAEVHGDRVVAEVADTGPGIAPDQLGAVFERFQRGDEHRDRPGFGLGLALAREIARAHGGRIEATSGPGWGTVFRVELPLQEAPARGPRPQSTRAWPG